MKKTIMTVIFLMLIAVCIIIPNKSFAAGENSVNAGLAALIGPDVSATAFFGEYERLLQPKMVLLGRLYSASYEFDDGDYEEDGSIIGVDGGIRFYPMAAAQEMKGFFYGAAAGIAKTDWDWIDDKGEPWQSRGKGDTQTLRIEGQVGYRFAISEDISIIPAFHLGNFFGFGSNDETELGFYSFFSVAVGFRF